MTGFVLAAEMTSSAASTADRSPAPPPPGAAVTAIGLLMALWCVGFAVFNVVFEITDRFADSAYAHYSSAITVMNWFVVGLKVLGAAVALLSVAKRPTFVPPALLAVLVWGAFATLGLYATGSVVQAVGMVSGLAGSVDQIDTAGVGYVLLFLLAAAGFGILAVSHLRRNGLRKGFAVLGVLGAPAVLGLVLLAVPTLLTVLGLMPTP